jgi:phage terminase small subunit
MAYLRGLGAILFAKMRSRNNKAFGLKITERQKKFCNEYLKDFNATAAYLRAGYSGNPKGANASGPRLLTNTNIQAYLCQITEKASREADVSRADVLRLVYARATANIANVIEFDAYGSRLKDSKTLPPEISRGISSIKWTADKEGNLQPSITMKSDGGAIKILSDFHGLTSSFDQLREGLKKYGIALVPDETVDIGWRVERHQD